MTYILTSSDLIYFIAFAYIPLNSKTSPGNPNHSTRVEGECIGVAQGLGVLAERQETAMAEPGTVRMRGLHPGRSGRLTAGKYKSPI